MCVYIYIYVRRVEQRTVPERRRFYTRPALLAIRRCRLCSVYYILCMYVCMYIYIYMYICLYRERDIDMHIYICTYIYIYTYTHAHKCAYCMYYIQLILAVRFESRTAAIFTPLARGRAIAWDLCMGWLSKGGFQKICYSVLQVASVTTMLFAMLCLSEI